MTSHNVENVICDRDKAPEGWYCTRDSGHEGPCAAKKTSLYSHCSHGISYKNPCHKCGLVNDSQTVKSWGHLVDAARERLATAGPDAIQDALK